MRQAGARRRRLHIEVQRAADLEPCGELAAWAPCSCRPDRASRAPLQTVEWIARPERVPAPLRGAVRRAVHAAHALGRPAGGPRLAPRRRQARLHRRPRGAARGRERVDPRAVRRPALDPRCSTARSTSSSAGGCCRRSTASGCARGATSWRELARDGARVVAARPAGQHACADAGADPRGDAARRLRVDATSGCGGRSRGALQLTRSAPRLVAMSLGARRGFERAVAEVDAVLYEVIERGPEGGLLGRAARRVGLAAQEVRDQLVTLLAAGHETTATALAWAFERLGRRPDVVAAAAATTPTATRSVKEVLRVRPVLSIAPRKLAAPFEVGGHDAARRRPGRAVHLPHAPPRGHLGRPARVPARAVPRRPAAVGYAWIPFGGGTRRCLGAAFALMEMEAVLDEAAQAGRLEPGRARARPAPRGHALARRAGGTVPVELLAVPNVSEGRDAETIEAIGDAFASTGARLLDVHSDADHHRVGLHARRRAGRARARRSPRARARRSSAIDLRDRARQHPHVGALDVAPVVFLDDERSAARRAPRRCSPPTCSASSACRSSSTACSRAAARAPSCGAGGLAGARRASTPDFGPRDDRRPRTAPRSSPRARRSSRSTSSSPRRATLERRQADRRARPRGRRRGPARRARARASSSTAAVAQVSTNVEDHRAVAARPPARGGRAPRARQRRPSSSALAPAAAFDGWPDARPGPQPPHALRTSTS